MLSRAPLLWFALSFILGISLNTCLPLNQIIIPLSAILFITIVITAFTYFTPKNTCKNKTKITNCLIFTFCICFIITGCLHYAAKYRELSHPTNQLNQKIESIEFKICEPSDLFLKGTKSGRWQSKATIININGIKPEKHTKVILTGKGDSTILSSDIIKAKHILVIKPKPSNFPGGFSYSRYMQTQNITTNIKILGKYSIHNSNNASIFRFMERIRAYAIQNTLKYAKYQTQGFLAAAIFGYREAISKQIKKSFRSTGIGHILAISGLHVGLIILIISFICIRLKLSPRRRAIITILACVIFLALSGGRSAVFRASIIAFVYLGGILLFRKSSFLNSLGAAALIICILNPLQIFDIGFQMSFISVAFIYALSKKFISHLQSLKPEYSYRRYPIKYFLKSLPYNISALTIVTISAWLGILPLTTYYFNAVSLIGFLTNLLIIPLMPLAITGGILLQLTPLLPYKLTNIFSVICSYPAHAILKICNTISHLPVTSIKLFPPSKEIIILYYILFIILFIHPLIFKRTIKALGIILSVSIVALILILFYVGNTETKRTTPSIALLRSRAGESVIIQGTAKADNNIKSNPENYTVLLLQGKAKPTEIIGYLYSQRIHTIDMLYFINKDQELPPDYYQWLKINKIELIKKTERKVASNLKCNNYVEINITRSHAGRILWYNIITQTDNILITNWHKESVYHNLIKSKQAGYNAHFKLLRINGKRIIDKPTAKSNSEYIIRDKDIHNTSGRKKYGIIIIKSGSITGWDGVKFILLKNNVTQTNDPVCQ